MNRRGKNIRQSARVSSGRSTRWAAWSWVGAGIVLGAGLAGAWMHRQHSASILKVSAAGSYCDSGIGAAKAHSRSAAMAADRL